MLLGVGLFAWWLTRDDGATSRSHGAAQVARAATPRAEVMQTASASADEAQVRRAYEQFQVTYADLGIEGLESFSQSCAQALGRDPRIIDYCVAFDAFAQTVASGSPWFDEASTRHVTLAQAALPPGVDAPGRLSEIRRLTRVAPDGAEPVELAAAAPVAEPARVPAAPARSVSPVTQKTRTASAPPVRPATIAAPARVQKASGRAAAKSATPRRTADRCAREATAAARAICQNPELRAADRRLKQAYERALAAGVDPLQLDRQQAQWRTAQDANAAGRDALARAYELRIGEIEAQARAPE